MDLNKVINAVQRSNITSEYRGLVALAVQEYYKELERAKVIKPKIANPVIEDEAIEEVEEIIVNEPIEVEEPIVKKTRKPRSKRS
jgi:hypothetical protein